MGDDHLAHMTGGGTEQKNSGSDDGRKTKVETSESGQEADGSKAEAIRRCSQSRAGSSLGAGNNASVLPDSR